MRHVDDGRLHAYLDGQLEQVEPGGVDAVERHLAGCDPCRVRLEQARRVRGEADSILAGMLPARLGEAMPAPAFRPAAPARPVRRLRPWIPAAWAASILLAVTAGWLARRPGAERQAARTPVESAAPAMDSAPAPVAATAPAAAAAPPQTQAARNEAGPVAQEPPRVAARAPERMRREDFTGVGNAGSAVAEAEEQVAMVTAAAPPPPPPPVPAPVAAAPPPPSDYNVETMAAADRSLAFADSLVLKGQVTDRAGQGVAGAQVRAPGVGASTVTRADGSYALSIPTSRLQGRDTVSVRVARPGMDTQTRTLALGRADTLDFALRTSGVAMESAGAQADDARRRVPTADAKAAAAAAAPPSTRREGRRPTEWVAVPRDEAEQLLRHRLPTVPDLPVLGYERGEVQGQLVVRVRQKMEGGQVLSLLLQRDSGVPASAAVELERERYGGVTLRQGALLVLVSGPIAPERLTAYGRRLRW